MIALLLLVACGADECHVESVEVADDAPAGDLAFNAADVLAAVGGAHEGMVQKPTTNETVPATLTLSRGEGAAVLHDATSGDAPVVAAARVPATSPLPPCDDALDVPVSGTLTVTDLGVDVAFAGIAGQPFYFGDTLRIVEVDASLPVDTPGLPTPPDAATEARLHLTFEDGEDPRIELVWAGPNESSEIVASTLGSAPATE